LYGPIYEANVATTPPVLVRIEPFRSSKTNKLNYYPTSPVNP
jgi:hypothetical protein